MAVEFRREYLVRLPLPLAQLYSRAYNAKDARSRHDSSFYLFEAIIKLAAAPAITAYVDEVHHEAPRSPALDTLIAQLALPSLGQWLAMLRELARHFGTRVDAAAHPLGHLWAQLSTGHRDWPGILDLYRRIKNGVDGQPAGDQSCSFLELLDALVQYRNAIFGHGGPRFESFFAKEMGPLLLPALNEVLAEGSFDLLGPRGSRLVYVTELRTIAEDRVEVGLRELVGLQGERMMPLPLTQAQAVGVLPNCVAVIWPGHPVPLSLEPLLRYRETDTAEELLFLNRDRNGRQVEYLSYTTGRTERDQATAPALAALLSKVVNRPVSEADLMGLATDSRAETPGPPIPAPTAGRILGDYEVLAEIGRGGMGVVYLARQLSLGRLVALKMLPADLAGDEVALAHFRREIRHLARCDHPNIVKVMASGTMPDGQLYYTMEYVPGSDLEHVWRELSGAVTQAASALGQSTWSQAVLTASRKRREETTHRCEQPVEAAAVLPLAPLPELPPAGDDRRGFIRRVVTLVRDAALALQAVHEQGLVHRDVKPANLMLTADGARVVLMDFGLAKGQSLALTVSKSGGFLGTLRYAAPEQLAAASLKVGPSADVRALGCVLWELLTRRRLFADASDEAQLAEKVHDEDVPRLRSVDSSLDRDLEAIVARATERRVADRIATAGRLAEYLQLYLEDKPLPIRNSQRDRATAALGAGPLSRRTRSSCGM
jgi:serine/threonine protein kinase